MWAILKGAVSVVFRVLKFAAAHPVIALAVGAAAILSARYIKEQKWWGAKTVGNLVYGTGQLLTGTSLASFIVGPGLGRLLGILHIASEIPALSATFPYSPFYYFPSLGAYAPF